MIDSQSYRTKLAANDSLITARFFYLGALLIMIFSSYLLAAQSSVLTVPATGLYLISFFLGLNIFFFLSVKWLSGKKSFTAVNVFSYVQIAADFIFASLFTVLSGLNAGFLVFLLPIFFAGMFWPSYAPITLSILFSAAVALYSTFNEILGTVLVLLIPSFNIEFNSAFFDPSNAIIIIIILLSGFLSAYLGKIAKERDTLISVCQYKLGGDPHDHKREIDDKSKRIIQAKEFEVERANERLSTLEKAKADFVSVTTHQLRTPLAGIKWTFEMLLKGQVGESNPNQREILEKGYASTERMIRMVNEILSIEKIENERFEVVFIYSDMVKLIENAVIEFQAPAIGKGLRLSFARPETNIPLVMMDADKVRMVLDNLIENAIKYTKIGGDINISLDSRRLNSARPAVEVTVKDNGIGISEKFQDDIFTKFYRGPNARKAEPGGTGLGLFISKTIIEAHGGTIWFESEENTGTVFHFSLPVHHPERGENL